MKIGIFRSSLLAAVFPFAAAADVYQFHQTPHFGFVTVEIANDFIVSSMCTVSGGASQERLESITDFLPGIGTSIMAALNWLSLDEGEVLCGLRHYEGPGPFTAPADTEGFDLTIRAYADGVQIGSDLSPSFACTASRPFNVNKTGLCFEAGERRNLDRQEAEYVVACIETRRPGDYVVVSFLLHAGEDTPDSIRAMVEDQAANVSEQPCEARTF